MGAGTSAGEALHLAQALVLRLYEASLRGLDRLGGCRNNRTPASVLAIAAGLHYGHQIVPIAQLVQLVLPMAELN